MNDRPRIPMAPKVLVRDITTTSATIKGVSQLDDIPFSSRSILHYRVSESKERLNSHDSSPEIEMRNISGGFSCTLNGLEPGTTYYAVAQTETTLGVKSIFSDVVEFRTLAEEKVVEAPAPRSHGVELIANERYRVIDKENYSVEHDVRFNAEGQLARAAACYALPLAQRDPILTTLWPWHGMFYKSTPADRIRELAKAGQLIAAEIDRLHALEQMRKTNG